MRSHGNKDVAKALRQRMTDAERSLWRRLRAHRLNGAKFKRQEPLGPYVVDFVCIGARLIIEVDGGQHQGNERDRIRDAWLGERGYRVLRFWNNDVLMNLDGVLETIARNILPLPRAGEGWGEGDQEVVLR